MLPKKNSISAEDYIMQHLESKFDVEVNEQKEKKKPD